jgi:histidyl-tRNA synthetase
VEYALTPSKSDKQFKRAMELKARFTVRLAALAQGGLELKLKNLSTREEKTLPVQEGLNLDIS